MLNSYLKKKFKEDKEFDEFFSRDLRFTSEKDNVDKKVMKLRKMLLQHKIPIKYYAVEKQKVIKKYFELLSDQITEDELDNVFADCKHKLDLLSEMWRHLVNAKVRYNRLYGECLYWALSVVEDEKESTY